MITASETIHVPLQIDEAGGIRVAETRVTLDTIIIAFQQGETPEVIISDYPSLKLADVYAVITYYLENKEIVDHYLQRRSDEREQIRQEYEIKHGSQKLLRERLMARIQQGN
jgi:uncharacterized protein (DUF433 family)